jgi:hypothetical protein
MRAYLYTQVLLYAKPIEEKESYCWLKGYEEANQIALVAPDTTVVSIADRGGDIYEVLEKIPSKTNKAYWLIRSRFNRKTLTGADARLWEDVKSASPIGEIEFKLAVERIYNRKESKRKKRKERIVRQEVRVCTVKVSPPTNKCELDPITINVIHCVEINPPNEEDKIEWYFASN